MSVGNGVTKGSLAGSDLSMPGSGADQWQEVGQVQSLYIYPVKSMSGVRVETFNVEKTGPRKVFSLFQNILFISHFQKWTISRQTVHGC